MSFQRSIYKLKLLYIILIYGLALLIIWLVGKYEPKLDSGIALEGLSFEGFMLEGSMAFSFNDQLLIHKKRNDQFSIYQVSDGRKVEFGGNYYLHMVDTSMRFLTISSSEDGEVEQLFDLIDMQTYAVTSENPQIGMDAAGQVKLVLDPEQASELTFVKGKDYYFKHENINDSSVISLFKSGDLEPLYKTALTNYSGKYKLERNDSAIIYHNGSYASSIEQNFVSYLYFDLKSGKLTRSIGGSYNLMRGRYNKRKETVFNTGIFDDPKEIVSWIQGKKAWGYLIYKGMARSSDESLAVYESQNNKRVYILTEAELTLIRNKVDRANLIKQFVALMWFCSLVLILILKLTFRNYPNKVAPEEKYKLGKKLKGSEIGNVQDEAVLAEILKDANYKVGERAKAANRIKNDQKTLYELVLDNKNEHIVIEALKNLSHQNYLRDLFASKLPDKLRQAIGNKIQDKQYLDAFYEKEDHDMRSYILDWTQNKELLELAALKDEHSDIRQKAVQKIFNQELLHKIALEDKKANVYQAAISKLENEDRLKEICQTDKRWLARFAATDKLKDHDTLFDIALNDERIEICEAATKKLKNQSHFEAIAFKHSKEDVRIVAASKIKDEEVLLKIVNNDKNKQVCMVATEHINRDDLLKSIAESHAMDSVRVTAVSKLRDQDLLAKIALNDKSAEVAAAATENLGDDDALVEITRTHSEWKVRMAAVRNLNCFDGDVNVLYSHIACNDEHKDVRYAAAIRIKSQTQLWNVGQEAELNGDDSIAQYAIQELGLTGITKRCENPSCLKSVSVFSRSGGICPHCGVLWGDEKSL